jgi:Zn-finger nucleic acid-binding protein
VFIPSTLLPRFQDTRDLGREVISAFPQVDLTEQRFRAMYVKCPRCGTRMNRRLFADGAKVVVDVCRGHGTWFDEGELRAVVEFVAGGGLARAAAKEWAEKEKLRKATREAALAVRKPADSPGNGWTDAIGNGAFAIIAEVLRGLFAWWR